jgi:5-methylcytosine-specific restriction endonuclease McrA
VNEPPKLTPREREIGPLLEALTPVQRQLIALFRQGETLADAAKVLHVSEQEAALEMRRIQRLAHAHRCGADVQKVALNMRKPKPPESNCRNCGQPTGSARRLNCDRCAPASEKRRRKKRRDATHCAWCGVPLTPAIAALDHIIPFAAGGTDDPHNLTPVCGQCNSHKSDTPLVVWLAKRALARSA